MSKTKRRITDGSKAVKELLPIWRIVYNMEKEIKLLKELLKKVGN